MLSSWRALSCASWSCQRRWEVASRRGYHASCRGRRPMRRRRGPGQRQQQQQGQGQREGQGQGQQQRQGQQGKLRSRR